MNREYHKWYSDELQRDMELLVFGHTGKPVLFFPTRMARFFDYENWGIVGAVADRIENGELQLFCVDSVDAESFYNNNAHPAHRVYRHIQYDQYIVQEVLPFIKCKNASDKMTVAGCSMGAYHAANIALKYPQFFNKVVCMSGRYDLTRSIDYFRDLFDGYHNLDIYFNMPRQFMANMHHDDLLQPIRQMDIILVIGQTDPFIYDNYEFSNLLNEKHVSHHFYIWDGFAHRPRYWKQMVRLYL